MLGDVPGSAGDCRALERKIAGIDEQLAGCAERAGDIENGFNVINDVFAKAEHWLAARDVELFVDHTLVKRDAAEADSIQPIDLVEIYSASGDRQTVLLGFVSSAEIPPPKNCCPRRSVISASAVAALDTHRLRLRHIGDTLITRLRRIGVSRRDAPSPLGSRMAFHVGRDVSP